MKKTIKLTENDIRRMVMESLSEIGNTTKGQYMLGRLAGRIGKRTGSSISPERQKLSDYAHNQRLQQLGFDNRWDNEPGSTGITNPLQWEYVAGIRDYDDFTNPDYEWDEGVWDDDTDRWISDVHRGSEEEEKRNAKMHLDNDEEQWKNYKDGKFIPGLTDNLREAVTRAIRKYLK